MRVFKEGGGECLGRVRGGRGRGWGVIRKG